jgi:hypothetical protein
MVGSDGVPYSETELRGFLDAEKSTYADLMRVDDPSATWSPYGALVMAQLLGATVDTNSPEDIIEKTCPGQIALDKDGKAINVDRRSVASIFHVDCDRRSAFRRARFWCLLALACTPALLLTLWALSAASSSRVRNYAVKKAGSRLVAVQCTALTASIGIIADSTVQSRPVAYGLTVIAVIGLYFLQRYVARGYVEALDLSTEGID